MNYHDWRSEQNPIRRTAKRLLSGDTLKDGRQDHFMIMNEYYKHRKQEKQERKKQK